MAGISAPCPLPRVPAQGLLSDHLAAAQPWRWERVFVPLKRHSRRGQQETASGGELALAPWGFHRPLSDPRADLRLRFHRSQRDGRNVPSTAFGATPEGPARSSAAAEFMR